MNWKQFRYLACAVVFYLLAGLAFVYVSGWSGVLLFFIGLGLAIHARLMWPADQDVYLNRNFTRR